VTPCWGDIGGGSMVNTPQWGVVRTGC